MNGFPIEVGSFWPREWIGQEKLLLFYWQITAHLHQILREFSSAGSTTGSSVSGQPFYRPKSPSARVNSARRAMACALIFDENGGLFSGWCEKRNPIAERSRRSARRKAATQLQKLIGLVLRTTLLVGSTPVPTEGCASPLLFCFTRSTRENRLYRLSKMKSISNRLQEV